jgi:hypothetical protein
LDAVLAAGARFTLPPEHQERAIYVVEGSLRITGQPLSAGDLVVLTAGMDVQIDADLDARAMILGGAPLDGPRHMVWNFVSSRTERIEQAKRDWAAQAMGQVPGETEFIPYP